MGLLNFTNTYFEEMDTDGSGFLDYSEFERWIKDSDAIQSFLMQHSGVGMQTMTSFLG